MPPLSLGLIWPTITELLKSAARTTTAGATSALVDVRGFKGPVAFILQTAKASAGTTPTLTPKLVHATASNGTPADLTGVVWYASDGETAWTEITDAADPGVLVAIIDPRETDGFVGIVGTIAGANASYTCAASYAGIKADPVPAANHL